MDKRYNKGIGKMDKHMGPILIGKWYYYSKVFTTILDT